MPQCNQTVLKIVKLGVCSVARILATVILTLEIEQSDKDLLNLHSIPKLNWTVWVTSRNKKVGTLDLEL